MSNIFLLDKGYIIASIINSKYKLFGEEFVSLKESNYISNEFQKLFNEKNINVCILSAIDSEHFYINQTNISVNYPCSRESVIELYHSYAPISILTLIWDHEFICQKLYELKHEEIKILKEQIKPKS